VIRWLLFLVLAGGLVGYAFWVYLRVELAVPAARGLAVVRALALVLVLLLLFDPRLPTRSTGDAPEQWVLLDASLSMAAELDGRTAWTAALDRARSLERDGWSLVRFGGVGLDPDAEVDADPQLIGSALAPALEAAAEAGAREVRVLSDLRFEDRVALGSALESLPLEVSFEAFGGTATNAGIASLQVPDLLQPDGPAVAELEVFGRAGGDSLAVEILEEDRVVATVQVSGASPGLRSRAAIDLPSPSGEGRVRYSARLATGGDDFPDDDLAVAFTNVGHEAGGLVLVSLVPDWEPRYLLPVLEEVTGLPAAGYLRAGPDRYVRLGRAVDRGAPVDSATVRRAATDAAVLVVHGIGGASDPWIGSLVARPGRRLLLPLDEAGAASVGVDVSPPREGEWYASPDVPTSPIAGALVGVTLQGLPPLSDVMVPSDPSSQPPLQLQLRGAGAPESALHLVPRNEGRAAVVLASGFWRWAMRSEGREPYRRVWSGVAGWLLADQEVAAAEPRPERWVFDRGEPVAWSLPADSGQAHLVVRSSEGTLVDTTVTPGGRLSTGPLPPGAYAYDVTSSAGDTIGRGRFDVAGTSVEMLPEPVEPALLTQTASMGAGDAPRGTPLRTSPWPYLLVIGLLCGEWIVRRRSGLR